MGSLINIDLSKFSPQKRAEWSQKIKMLESERFDNLGHPEILTILWEQNERIETVFPTLAPYVTYK